MASGALYHLDYIIELKPGIFSVWVALLLSRISVIYWRNKLSLDTLSAWFSSLQSWLKCFFLVFEISFYNDVILGRGLEVPKSQIVILQFLSINKLELLMSLCKTFPEWTKLRAHRLLYRISLIIWSSNYSLVSSLSMKVFKSVCPRLITMKIWVSLSRFIYSNSLDY